MTVIKSSSQSMPSIRRINPENTSMNPSSNCRSYSSSRTCSHTITTRLVAADRHHQPQAVRQLQRLALRGILNANTNAPLFNATAGSRPVLRMSLGEILQEALDLSMTSDDDDSDDSDDESECQFSDGSMAHSSSRSHHRR
jgi:hypothetical protein